MSELTTHDLKTWPEPFQAILDGRKAFEVRRCDDRIFSVGDRLRLREWSPLTRDYTGRETTTTITYMVPGGAWGLPPELCVLGITVPASRLEAAIARAERAEAFIESLSTGRAGTANRCTGIARTDSTYGDIACMRLANHDGEHVALYGDALAADLDDARAALARVTKERDEAHSIVSSGIAQVDGLRIALTAAREREQALVALLKEAHESILNGAAMLHRDVLTHGNDKADRAANRLRDMAARIDAATGEK